MFLVQLLPILAFIGLFAWGLRGKKLGVGGAVAFFLLFAVFAALYLLSDAMIWPSIGLMLVLDLVLAAVVFASDVRKL